MTQSNYLSWKRSLHLPEGFETLNEWDAVQKLEMGNPSMDRYTLSDYLTWNTNPNEVSIVYKREGLIAGIIALTVHDDFVTVEMIGRNVAARAPSVGTKLMSLAEDIARQLGRREIRLESAKS
jgi:ribosomal protein S18 acetylase RimI-like enzyme